MRGGKRKEGEGRGGHAIANHITQNIAQETDILIIRTCIRTLCIHIYTAVYIYTYWSQNIRIYECTYIHTEYMTILSTQNMNKIHLYVHTIYTHMHISSLSTGPTLSHTASRYPPNTGSSTAPYTFRCTLATIPSRWSRKS